MNVGVVRVDATPSHAAQELTKQQTAHFTLSKSNGTLSINQTRWFFLVGMLVKENPAAPSSYS